MDFELCYLSATEAIALFKAKKLSPAELLHVLIERARQAEPRVNAFSYEYFDEALAAAKVAGQHYINGDPRPLEGIAVAIKDEVEINGIKVDPMLGWVMTTPFNTLSRCPVLSVPSGQASNGVPTGIQMVGKTYRDQDVFRAAMAYEASGPWFGSEDARPGL